MVWSISYRICLPREICKIYSNFAIFISSYVCYTSCNVSLKISSQKHEISNAFRIWIGFWYLSWMHFSVEFIVVVDIFIWYIINMNTCTLHTSEKVDAEFSHKILRVIRHTSFSNVYLIAANELLRWNCYLHLISQLKSYFFHSRFNFTKSCVWFDDRFKSR